MTYRTADFMMPDVDDQVDIRDMHIYPDGYVDFFICSHVLEHVTDDGQALAELARILKPGGEGILMVPIWLHVEDIDEEPSLTDVAERWRRFGQDDHIRRYSKQGVLQRVRQAGFEIAQLGVEYFGTETFRNAAIAEQSVLYL